MEKESFTTKMEEFMMESGLLEKCMVKVTYILRMVNWLIRDNGMKTSSTDKAPYIMISLNS